MNALPEKDEKSGKGNNKMALNVSTDIANILKVYYKDGVENLLFRESPIVKQIGKTRVEGKQQNFAAVYGAGGAVSGKFTQAKAKAAEVVKNAEFQVTPGQLFSTYSMNSKEVQSSLTKKGAYMKVAGNKLFAATSALRRTLAAAFYGDGYGVIGNCPSSATISTTGTQVTFTDGSIPATLDVGSVVQLVASKGASDADSTKAEVTAIEDYKVTFAAATSNIAVTSSTMIRLHGSVDNSGNPLLPMGLAGWLPTDRTGLSTSFFGVNRSISPDRLAGVLVDSHATNEAKKVTIQKAINRVRRHGSKADLIIMNDEDFLAFSAELESTNTYFTATSTKEAKKASVGFRDITASFSTNYIDNIVDDPFCPKGRFYVLDKDSVEFWSYTNADFVDNGIAGNNPGKEDVMDFDNEGKANDPAKLLIDDYINVQPGSGSDDGPDVLVTLQLFGSYVVLNPANCAVGLFYQA